MPTSRFHPLLALLLLACVTTGCGRDGDATGAAGEGLAANGDTLPKPEPGAGSVTGLPGSRAGAAADIDLARGAADDSPESDAEDTGMGIDMEPVEEIEAVAEAGDGNESAPPPGAAEPPGADAAAVVRNYYGAIAGGQYDRAYRFWSDGGRSSGQTEDEFEAGFAQTAAVTVQTGAPGRVEGAAGSRYVTIPVTINAVDDEGDAHRYQGTYTLRRAVVDGASAEQRDWRIESADLREVQ